jgi:pimeloyl-ACP methyl ester carboxylesterase
VSPRIVTPRASVGLNYIEQGSGEPIVLAAAPGHEGTVYAQEFIPVLAPHFRAIAYDARGSGGSDRSEWYSYKSAGEDLADLLDALGIEKALVYGSSGGGIQALRFALHHPEQCNGVIVDATSAEVNATAAANWRRVAEKALLPDPSEHYNVTGPSAFDGNEFRVQPRFVQGADKDPRARFVFFWEISDLYERPLTPLLAGLKPPLLILIGDQDKLAGVGGSVKMHRVVSGSRLRIVKGAGHSVLATRPDVAVGEILQFAAELAANAS